MVGQANFKFNVGDRVVVNLNPIFWGKLGTVTGRYGRHDWIPREHDTVVTTVPWPELMYTVLVDGSDSPTIAEESCLRPSTAS